MDKYIRKIRQDVKKDAKKEVKELKSLEKLDKKRDKLVDMGSKVKKETAEHFLKKKK